jgi:hypothetical protein
MASNFDGLVFTILGEGKLILVLRGYMGSTSLKTSRPCGLAL